MVSLKDRRIVLIGGAGFIGHHLALLLKSRGAKVDIVDGLIVNNILQFTATGTNPLYLKFLNERIGLLKKADIPIHLQDARDYHALSRILHALQPQVIIHLAAVAHTGKSNKDPFTTFDHSLRTLENTLDIARELKVEHLVFFSSSMVYGNFQTSEVTEDHPLNPIGIYGALKVAGEKLVIAYNQVFGIPYTIIRPSALYGPRCVSRRVIQIFLENALLGQPLKIEGDGKEKLDFTYIDDLVQGIVHVLTKEEAKNEIFNLTYGRARSVLEVVEVLRDIFKEVVVENVRRDHLEPFRGTLSTEKASHLLEYKPVTGIEDGIPAYMRSYEGHI